MSAAPGRNQRPLASPSPSACAWRANVRVEASERVVFGYKLLKSTPTGVSAARPSGPGSTRLRFAPRADIHA